MPFGQLFVRSVSTTAIGILEGAINAFKEVAAQRISRASGMKTAQDPNAQMALARARSTLAELKFILQRNIGDLTDAAKTGREISMALAQEVLRGERPSVRIAGDVQLAAEVNWLVDHVRWDVEEDLARVLGDAQAHTLGQAARGLATALRQFMGTASTTGAGKAAP